MLKYYHKFEHKAFFVREDLLVLLPTGFDKVEDSN